MSMSKQAAAVAAAAAVVTHIPATAATTGKTKP